MLLYIDVPWLLDVQEQALPEDVSVADYSALVAAAARHRTKIPRHDTAGPDAAWRAAALLHTLVRLEPLPYRNSLYACQVTAAYMHASGEGIDPRTGPWSTWSATSGPARPTSSKPRTTSEAGASDACRPGGYLLADPGTPPGPTGIRRSMTAAPRGRGAPNPSAIRSMGTLPAWTVAVTVWQPAAAAWSSTCPTSRVPSPRPCRESSTRIPNSATPSTPVLIRCATAITSSGQRSSCITQVTPWAGSTRRRQSAGEIRRRAPWYRELRLDGVHRP